MSSLASPDRTSPPEGPAAPVPAPAVLLTAIGCCCVVLGGLVAAVTDPIDLAHGSWTAAYLVLIGGATQYAMGRARTRHPVTRQPVSWGWAELVAWNLGNALVIGGTWMGEPLLVDVGSAFLVLALGIALHATRPAPAGGAVVAASPGVWCYRIALLVVTVSIPVGIVLSHLRHG